MKFLKRLLLLFLLSLALFAGGLYSWLLSLKPQYQGSLHLAHMKDKARVVFDRWGIPHIYAGNEADAMRVLGWCQAQERLFQMEMLRRVGHGNLAALLGKDYVPVDRFFYTLGIPQHAGLSADFFRQHASPKIQALTNAFLDGINQYIDHGKTPVEFTLMGIPKTHFQTVDLFAIAGYMSFSFVEAFHVDPVLSRLVSHHGNGYLEALAGRPAPAGGWSGAGAGDGVAALFQQVQSLLPCPPMVGSNSLILGPSKTKSGRVLFENDTHIGYAQPAVWFEAHIDCPEIKLYGNYLAGIPFPLVAHSDYCAYGLTMYENDDVDFFHYNLKNKNRDSAWQEAHQVLQVKGQAPVNFLVRRTGKGPLISDANGQVGNDSTEAVAVYWTYTQAPTRNLEVFYELSHARSMANARQAAARITAPGLNIMYGDRDGHIGHWASARLFKRKNGAAANLLEPDSVEAPTESFPFEENPQEEDPDCGYVLTANQDQILQDESYYPGYYAPADRLQAIRNAIAAHGPSQPWEADDLKKIFTGTVNQKVSHCMKLLAQVIRQAEPGKQDAFGEQCLRILAQGDGAHELDSKGVVIYYRLLYHVLKLAMQDELGYQDFHLFLNTHFMKTGYPMLLEQEDNLWWDNILTPGVKESRSSVVLQAWKETILDFQTRAGSKDPALPAWGEVHFLRLEHPAGKVKPLDKIFNVGPVPAPGGIETINNISFNLDSTGIYYSSFGPQMRIVIDFADPGRAWSVLPSGESGYFLSPHYADQTALYVQGKFRMMLMNRADIEKDQSGALEIE